MANLPVPGDRGRLRVSDADREQAAEVLRQAAGDGRITFAELDERLTAAYAARTYADLDALTSDLPGPGTAAQPPARRGGAVVDPAAPAGPSFSVAIMSGARRAGPWSVPARYTAVAIMGGVELDLRQARLREPVVTIGVFALMGGVSIIVPDDIQVDVSGFAFMGGFDHSAAGPGTPGAPVVRVTGFALMGGVDIRRRPADQAALPDQPALPGQPAPADQEEQGTEGPRGDR